MPTIAIVGAGFSGSMLAVHLMRLAGPEARVMLIDRRQRFGRGLAYSTDNPAHLLNVPAGRMSAFATAPTHFLDWLNTRGSDHYSPASFIPRRLYGDYIEGLLAQAASIHGDRLERIAAQALDLKLTAGGVTINLSNDRAVTADRAVLALGNFPPLAPAADDSTFYASDRYLADPWRPGALDLIPPAASVVLIGAGLTAVDVAIALLRRGRSGPIHAVSRHGLTPRRHLPPKPKAPAAALFQIDQMPLSSRQLLRTLRQRVRADPATAWQTVIDAMRPITQQLWSRLPALERSRFMRHLQPWWDVHRHRLAPEVAAQIDAAQASGQLLFHAARIAGYAISEAGVTVTIRRRGTATAESIEAQYVINCTGPASDYRRIDDPLVRSLLNQGLVRPGPFNLGLDVAPSLHLIAIDGKASGRLYAAGPVTKGALWEIIAVPDLRLQVEALAQHLVEISVQEPAASATRPSSQHKA